MNYSRYGANCELESAQTVAPQKPRCGATVTVCVKRKSICVHFYVRKTSNVLLYMKEYRDTWAGDTRIVSRPKYRDTYRDIVTTVSRYVIRITMPQAAYDVMQRCMTIYLKTTKHAFYDAVLFAPRE